MSCRECCQPTVHLYACDFDGGTYTIDRPGLYVLQEDVAFDPQGPDPGSTSAHRNPFSAIRITCPHVVLDLNQKRLGQSLRYYARMRVFNIIQLNISPFVNGQGPGTFNREQGLVGEALVASCSCVIRNGTLALSSHNCIHGNNNIDVHIHDVVCSNFDVGGVQLNACRNVTVERVDIRPTQWCPFSSYSLMSGLHATEEAHLGDAWAFILERAEAIGASTSDMDVAQRALWEALRDKEGDIPCLRVIRSRIGRADGSAMYGVLVNCEGHATGRLEDGEPTSEPPQHTCAVARAHASASASGDETRKTRSSVVSLFDVTIRDMHLDSLEVPCAVDSEGVPITHASGASVPYPCNEQFAEWYDHFGMLVDGISDATPIVLCNMDVMRHVCKGLFGVRLHCVDCAHVSGLTLLNLQNHSRRVCVPRDVKIIQPETRDTNMDHKFCGCDLYGVFIGFCKDVVIESATMERFCVHEPHGVIRAMEVAASVNVQTNGIAFSNMRSVQSTMVHVQNDSQCVYLENMEYTTRKADKTYAREKVNQLCQDTFRGEGDANVAMVEWILYNLMNDPCMINSERSHTGETCL